MGGRDEKCLLQSFYIASWAPHQRQWYFADGNRVHKEGMMKLLFPSYVGELCSGAARGRCTGCPRRPCREVITRNAAGRARA